MASIIARLPSPPLMVFNGRESVFATRQMLAIPTIRGKRSCWCNRLIAKATGESSDSSLIKSVQNVWDNSEDRIALFGLGFAGVVAFWASLNLVSAIDKLPILPSVFELVGILFSSWFTYRYLLFKPDREELSQAISKSVSNILGQ